MKTASEHHELIIKSIARIEVASEQHHKLMKELSVDAGRNLRNARHDASISLRSMAESIGCSIMLLSYVERGKRTASRKLATAIWNRLRQ